ncbi:hypothetical protein FO519_009999 [Halicephalobus sp. NKZ332]|nr:hypothetical protein FO519_009999 [Halicephalobus sp. NKZ332]
MGDTETSCDYVIPKDEISQKRVLRARVTLPANASDKDFEADFFAALKTYAGLDTDQVTIVRKRCLYSSGYLDVYFVALPWRDVSIKKAESNDFIRNKTTLLNQSLVRIQSIKLLEGDFNLPPVPQPAIKPMNSSEIDESLLGISKKKEENQGLLIYLVEHRIIEQICFFILCFFIGGLFMYCLMLIKKERIRWARKGDIGFFEILDSDEKKYMSVELHVKNEEE